MSPLLASATPPSIHRHCLTRERLWSESPQMPAYNPCGEPLRPARQADPLHAHSWPMELHSLGNFRLLAPLAVHSPLSRLYLARPESEQKHEHESSSYLAKILVRSRGIDDAKLVAAFEHEARLLRTANHPGIPSLHAGGEQDGVHYIVIDHVDGVDLAHLLGHSGDGQRSLSKEIAVYIAGQLAEALHHLHELAILEADKTAMALEVIHRDVCPSNVLLSRDGDVLLGDLGSATSRWLSPAHDMLNTGNKGYMAPERVLGTASASVQSDLFSFAVILWEMLRGERCFKAEDELKTMDTIVRFDALHPSRRIPGLSPKLAEIVRRNLDRAPERRYESAYQVLQRLAQSPEATAAEQSRLELARMVRAAAG